MAAKNTTVKKLIDQYADQYLSGDKEFKMVLYAIALAESGGNPNAIGDNGNSIGIFQNNMAGGRGTGHTKEDLLDPEYNIRISMKELFNAFMQGRNMGITGSSLATFVSRVAQRPQAGLEENAGRNYGREMGDDPIVTNEPQVLGAKEPTPTQAYIDPTRTPTPTQTPRQKDTEKWVGYMKKESKKPVWKRFLEYMNPTRPINAADGDIGSVPVGSPTMFDESNRTPMGTGTLPLNAQYTVKQGDTLWDIAQRTLGSGSRWKELGFQGDPRNLPIGQSLTIKNPDVIPGRMNISMARPYVPPPQPYMPQSQRMTPVSANIPRPTPVPTPSAQYSTPASQPRSTPVSSNVPYTPMQPRISVPQFIPRPAPTPRNVFPVANMADGRVKYSDGSIR